MKKDEQEIQRIFASLRQQAAADDKHSAERWDVPGVNCELPKRPGAATSVGDPDIDTAVDAINAGAMVIGGLDDTDLSPKAAVQLLSDIATARRRLDAAYLKTVAVADHLDAASASGLGAQTTAGLLKALAGLMPGRAKADVAAARAVFGQPASAGTALVPATPQGEGPLRRLGELLADGEITAAHVDTAVRTLAKLPTEILDASMAPSRVDDDAGDGETEKFEPEIVRDRIADYFARTAPGTTPDNLQRLAKHLIQVLDPDTDDHFDPNAFDRRSMTIATDITGMVFGTYQLDAAAGAKLRAILDPLSAPRPAQSDENGDVLVRDERTAEQRRADGLMELVDAGSALTAPGTAPGTAPDTPSGGDPADIAATSRVRKAADMLFGLEPDTAGGAGTSKAAKFRPGRRPATITVVTTQEKLTGADQSPSHCFQTGQIDPGTLSRMACDATFERLVMNSDGAILDLGLGVRLASPAQKRAVAGRDKGCVFPGCDRPPSWCDVHHVKWFSHGGPTDVGNLCLLCPVHHTLIHTGRWELTMIRGVPYARPAPEEITVKFNGAVAKIYGSQSPDGMWVRNSYFDQLKDAETLARAIKARRPDAA